MSQLTQLKPTALPGPFLSITDKESVSPTVIYLFTAPSLDADFILGPLTGTSHWFTDQFIGRFLKQSAEKPTITIDVTERLGTGEAVSSPITVTAATLDSSMTDMTSTIIDTSYIAESDGIVSIPVKAGTLNKDYSIRLQFPTDSAPARIHEADVKMIVGFPGYFGYFVKQPYEEFNVGVDFSNRLSTGEGIASQTVSATILPADTVDATATVIDSAYISESSGVVVVPVKAGSSGVAYNITVTATTNATPARIHAANVKMTVLGVP